MKKSLKAIIALMLVALFAVAMIPAVSAEGDTPQASTDTLIIKNESADFSFNIYKIATLSSTATGQYTMNPGLVDSQGKIKAEVNTPDSTKQAGTPSFLAALDAIAETEFGTPVVKLTAMNNGTTEKSFTEPGIYYARICDQPQGNVAKVKNSVIVWPEYRNGAWQYDQDATTNAYIVDLGKKVGTDKITKKFADTNDDYKDKGQGDVVEFKLTADIVGANEDGQKATKYQIWDKMCPGLEYVKGADNKLDYTVKYDDGSDAKDDFKDVVITGNITDTDAKYNKGTQFVFEAKDATLAGTSGTFYTHKEVIIQYKATVLNSATIGKDYNPNKDGLVYRLTGQDADVERPGAEVKVYTYSAEAYKIDASATAKAANNENVPLGGAVIGLYSDAACSTLIASGTSDDQTGRVEFKKTGEANTVRLAPGKYYVKEISAPAGYALSTAVYDLTITADHTGDGMFDLDGDKVIENFATKMPETGGQGTWMFTIIGIALILCAGALFIIVMKKKSTK